MTYIYIYIEREIERERERERDVFIYQAPDRDAGGSRVAAPLLGGNQSVP